MVTLVTVLFGMGVAAAMAIIVTVVATLTTRIRLWPPGDDSRKTVLHWGFVAVFNLSAVGVAVFQWNTWMLPRPSSLVVGVLLSVSGAAVFVRSVRALSATETTGQAADELYTDGLYARSRNPQYGGIIVGLVGFILLANSAHVTVLGALHVCWLVLLPFAEEPWLRAQFGEEYDRYCERVPRFIGKQTFHRN